MEQQEVSDLVAYVREHKGDSFAEASFNAADGLVLAELAYIHWDELGIDYPGDGSMTLKDAISKLPAEYLNSQSRNFYDLIMAVKDSERFGDMRISNYFSSTVTAEEVTTFEELEQFSAVTFSYVDEDGDTRHYVSYRGTDGTLEGWCEDFNMAYDSMTEAQKRAVEYLNDLAYRFEGDFQLGGHSKGGNNAMYAYLFCDEDVRERIFKLCIYDSPGFIYDLYYEDPVGNRHPVDPAVYEQMMELLDGTAICPFDSVIGLLLTEMKFIFVETDGAMVLDHDAFLWRLDPVTGEFVTREQSKLSKYLNELLDDWITRVPVEYRETFMKAIWGWIYSLGVPDFDSLLNEYIAQDWKAAIASLIAYVNGLQEADRNVFVKSLGKLVILALDDALEEGYPGYETIRDRIFCEMAERQIRTLEDLWRYLSVDPVANTLDLLQSIIMDWDTLVALTKAGATAVVIMKLTEAAVFLAQLTMGFVAANLPVIAAILAAVVVCGLAIDYIRQHWDELVRYAALAVEFVRQKIEEFASAMRVAITASIHAALAALVYTAKEVAEGLCAIAEGVVNVLEEMGRLTAAVITGAVAISNPLLYTMLRVAVGLYQSQVTIDMVRLQHAVDTMDALATRIANVDARLDRLYRKLCINNIEQSEGIFTSLANLYNLTSADINVDQGGRIRRKANALSDLFAGYQDAENWVLSRIQSGG